MTARWLPLLLIVLGLAACSSAPKKPVAAGGHGKPAASVVQGSGGNGRPVHCPEGSPYAKAQENPATRGNYSAGGLYLPGVKDSTPDYVPDVACIPEPVVASEPRSAIGNKSPYSVLGKEYRVLDKVEGYAEQGTASYYGAKFHGRLTSNREVYDMYAFSAAHKTLPLPSFARVTNLDNGESVIVRVNDRGPFHDGRVIDLSYAAAVRLGITQRGTGRVEVRALTSADDMPPQRGERAIATATAAHASKPAPAPSRMDQLVQKLPATPPAAMPSAAVTQAAIIDTAPVAVQPLASSAADPAPASPAPVATPVARTLGGILLQVASFSSRDNAARALGQLSSAGIAGASLSDVVSGGRTLWRLRVNADDLASATELAGRIAGLGFGKPQIVRD